MSNSKNYYTEAVKVVDLPVYLDEQYINYKLIFLDQIGMPLTGKLDSSKMIASIGVNDKHVKVMLIIYIQDIEIKKINLSVFDDIKTKEISLKSTVSETCIEQDNTCSFNLKLNIYTINKQSNQAILLGLSEVEKIAKERNLIIGYYIKRRSGGVSKTSKETIDKINNPSKIANKYIKHALECLKNESNAAEEDYSRLMYRDLMAKVFEYFLKNSKDPDSVVDEIVSIFGTNMEDSYMRSELLAFYHIYEALIPKTHTSPGYDKIQHFTYSTGKSYNTMKIITDTAQYAGEAYDLINGGSWDDTKSDMEANNLGQAYGTRLYEKYHPVRAAIRNLD
ncbi:hypothetical protein [Siccibacter turicensis]|uniref:hypothetical protein n=1 Tax=Siccibacter turicensis TaxID=357233 RepID=UPI002A69D70B|nr:hypothetical protein [Siccibacter turicensis]MDY0973310.1 hypothetical protein [Siccibacter turicensis]